MPENLGEAVVKVGGDASGAIAAIDSTQSHLGASIFIFRTAGYALQSIGQAALSGFSSASTAARDFNATLVKIGNLSSIADFNIKNIHDSLLKMSVETGRVPQEIADGFYFAASVLLNSKDALAVTEIAAKGAAIGLGTVGDITRTLTGIMNVYGLKADDVNGIMNTLIIMVKDGAGEADAFAGAIGRIIPIAKVAGVSFNDIGAALSTATRAGLSVDEATTAITRTLTELIGSTANTNKELMTLGFSQTQITEAMKDLAIETGTTTKRLETYGLTATQSQAVVQKLSTSHTLAEKAMKQYGLTTTEIKNVEAGHEAALATLRKQLEPYGMSLQDIDSVLKAYSKDTEEGRLALGKYGISSDELRQTLAGPNGLYNALTLIEQRTGGNDAELRKIFPNIRGFIGILATAGTQGAEYKSILDEMNGALTTTDAAFKNAAQTQQFAQQQAQAAMDTLKIRVGEALAPTLIAVLNALTPLLQSISDFATKHPTAFQDITLGLLGMSAGLYALGTAAQAAAGFIAISRTIVFLSTHAGEVAFLATSFSALGRAFAVAGAFMLGTGGAIVLLIGGIILIGYLLITNWKQLGDTVGGLGKLLGTFFVEVWTKVRNAIGGFFSWLGSTAQGVLRGVGGLFSGLGTAVHSAWNGLVGIVKGIINGIVKEWNALPNQIVDGIKAFAGLVGFAIGRMIKFAFLDPIHSLLDFIQGIPVTIHTMWTEIPVIAGIIWNAVKVNTVNAVKSAWTWLSTTWTNSIAWLKDMWDHLPTNASNAWNYVQSYVSGIVSVFIDWLKTAWSTFVDNVVTLWKSLPDKASAAWDQVKAGTMLVLQGMLNAIIGKDGIFDRIINYLTGLGATLWKIASDVAGSFWDGFKKGLGISSPSYIERAFMQIAKTAHETVGSVHTAVGTLNSLAPGGLTVNSQQTIASVMAGPAAALVGSALAGSRRGIVSTQPITQTIYISAMPKDIIDKIKMELYKNNTELLRELGAAK